MRRRFAIGTTLLLAAALLAWVAAPALSLRPYTFAVEDFAERLPEPKRIAGAPAEPVRHGAHAHEAARWISPPVAAEDRFDLVGVAKEMRHLEIRVRDEGGEWTEWVPQADGTPVYVGGADEAQVRAEFKPEGELVFVNVSGTSRSPVETVLDDARGAINSAFISLASTPVAEAFAGKPKIVTRSKWGADVAGGCVPRGPAEYGGVGTGVIHHTVNANTYAKAEAPGIVLGICRFHVDANGWNDIGYNALVDRFGRVYEGRAGGLKFPVVGAHAQGFNSQTTSVASIGNHSTGKMSKKARAAVIRFLAWKLKVARATPANGLTQMTSQGGTENRYPEGAVVTVRRVIGHGAIGLTECPGATLPDSAVRKIAAGIQKRIKGKRPKKKRALRR